MILFLPDLVALVLVADGQQVQQDLIEVAQGEVYTHHCNCISGSHLRTAERETAQKDQENLTFVCCVTVVKGLQ